MLDFLKKKKIIVKKEVEYVVVDNSKKLEGKIAIVTGATGSIGSAIAKRLCLDGANVVLTGRTLEKLNALKEEMEKQGFSVCYEVMDVTNEDSIKNAINSIGTKFGKIDILVNNAGYSARVDKKPLHGQSVENIDNLLNTNLRGTILTSKYVVEFMKKSTQGRIINISSIVGIQGKRYHVEYASAKAGLFGLTKAQAIELGEYKITVNCISPGLVPRENASNEKLSSTMDCTILKEICQPEDIANGVAFLASNDARMITGQNIPIDGGRSLGLYGDK